MSSGFFQLFVVHVPQSPFFFQTTPNLEIVQTVSARLSWSHNTALLDKVKMIDFSIMMILCAHVKTCIIGASFGLFA
jgi:hypothetical protein